MNSLLCNTNNLIEVICLHIVKWLNSSILPIHGNQKVITFSAHSSLGSNSDEQVLHIFHRS